MSVGADSRSPFFYRFVYKIVQSGRIKNKERTE